MNFKNIFILSYLVLLSNNLNCMLGKDNKEKNVAREMVPEEDITTTFADLEKLDKERENFLKSLTPEELEAHIKFMRYVERYRQNHSVFPERQQGRDNARELIDTNNTENSQNNDSK